MVPFLAHVGNHRWGFLMVGMDDVTAVVVHMDKTGVILWMHTVDNTAVALVDDTTAVSWCTRTTTLLSKLVSPVLGCRVQLHCDFSLLHTDILVAFSAQVDHTATCF